MNFYLYLLKSDYKSLWKERKAWKVRYCTGGLPHWLAKVCDYSKNICNQESMCNIFKTRLINNTVDLQCCFWVYIHSITVGRFCSMCHYFCCVKILKLYLHNQTKTLFAWYFEAGVRSYCRANRQVYNCKDFSQTFFLPVVFQVTNRPPKIPEPKKVKSGLWDWCIT